MGLKVALTLLILPLDFSLVGHTLREAGRRKSAQSRPRSNPRAGRFEAHLVPDSRPSKEFSESGILSFYVVTSGGPVETAPSHHLKNSTFTLSEKS